MASQLFLRIIPIFEGQSEPAMEENAWSVWDLFAALVENV